MKLLRTIRLDPSDTFVFDVAAEPGEWAVPGGFAFWDEDPAQMSGKRRQAFRIVLPQAMRSILPAAFNDIIGLAKGTSNVYILALPELFYTIQIIYRRNLEVIPLLMVATVWYLVILTVLSLLLERTVEHACGDTWRNVSDRLRRIQLAQLSSPHGTVWQVTDPTPEAAKCLKSLQIKPPPPVLKLA